MVRFLALACVPFAFPAGASVAVTVAPPAGEIAFVREDPTRRDINAAVDLWIVRTDRRGARRIVGTPGWDEAPAWSPDGSRIAFDKGIYEASEREDILKTIDVWSVRADGRGLRNLTRDGSASSPAWSPNSRALAFGRGNGIFVVRRDGSRRRQVARRFDPTTPAWSPDGGRIAFVTPGELWIVGAGGKSRRLLARGASSDTRAVWSPDGRTLSYAGASGGASGVFVVNAAGGRPKLLSRRDEEARWSPDGRRIALVRSGTPREAGIFVATPNGGARRRLTRGLDTEPTWSPDGRRIAFTRGLLVGDIFVVNIDGSSLRNLTRTPKLDERQPAWRPS
jgi:Tol biopolymer transport system component